jgi:hypothetical protein
MKGGTMRAAVHGHNHITHNEMAQSGVDEILEALNILWCLGNERHGIAPLTY